MFRTLDEADSLESFGACGGLGVIRGVLLDFLSSASALYQSCRHVF
jgi:hypothetical protein